MARHRTTFCLAATSAWLLFASSSARAYEGQASLDAAPGYTLLAASDRPTRHGAGFDLGGALGLSDIAVARVALGYLILAGPMGRTHAGRLRAELLYLVDVLQFVPFFGLGGDLMLAQGGGFNEFRALPGGHFVFGADYLMSRTWTLGIDVRSGVFFERGSAQSASDVSLRVSRMFETF